MNIINNDLNNKFQDGKIYKIICRETGKIYVGSTTKPLEIRLFGHKRHYTSYLNDKNNYVTSFEILTNGNYFIELICNAACTSKYELNSIEGNYIRNLDCVNRCVPGRTQKQYKDDHADTIKKYEKKYREEHAVELKQYKKQYREEHVIESKKYREEHAIERKQYNKKYIEEHAIERKQYTKKYREEHAVELKQYKKIYIENNAVKLKQKINCECGGMFSFENKARHYKTARHLNYLKIEL